MKQKWSNRWVSSKQPRKQRKYRHNAPMHIRQQFVSIHLSPALRMQFKTRSVTIRKGDDVKVMEGSLRGKSGTVERVNLKKCKVYADKIKIKKVDGSEVMKALEPSNLMITKLNLDDKIRQKLLERKRKAKEAPSKKKKELKKKDTKKPKKAKKTKK